MRTSPSCRAHEPSSAASAAPEPRADASDEPSDEPSDERDTQRLPCNGVDGAGGGYLLPPLSAREVARVARGEGLASSPLPGGQERRAYREDLRRWHQYLLDAPGGRGTAEGIDPQDLAQTGWGVVFAHDADPADPGGAGRAAGPPQGPGRGHATERFYREFAGPDGYRPGETKRDFLARHGAGPGPADPEKVPYYLLLVGEPGGDPLRASSTSSTCSTPSAACTSTPPRSTPATPAASSPPRRGGRGASPAAAGLLRRARIRGDPTTALTPTQLHRAAGRPSPRGSSRPSGLGGRDGAARRRRPRRAWAGCWAARRRPALLFTASHGMGFPNGDPRQLPAPGGPAVPGLARPPGLAQGADPAATTTSPATTWPTTPACSA